ncbi:hypothetical protein ABPG77_002508 [Micractinium sp. CCAP 211/92]
MTSLARAPALAASAPRKRPVAARRGLVSVQANTLWSLHPDAKWCAKPENADFCKRLGPVDLTGTIGTKRVCHVASHDFQSEEAQDLCILDHGGIHLLFEAEGTANPLDSPSRLYVTDVDSKCSVMLDGRELEKAARTQVRPGACLCLGQEAQYIVLRNVFAHA